MMDSEDGKVRWSVFGGLDEERSVSQSIDGGSDKNLFTITPRETLCYAFLDSVEHEVAEVTGAVFSQRFNLAGKEFEEGTRLLVARFDCVTRDFFHVATTKVFRDFYASVRGEDIDDAHDLDKEYWHDEQQTLLHQAIIQQFLAEKGQFFVLYVVLHATPENEHIFDQLFLSEGWVGLGLFQKVFKPGVPVVAYDRDDHELKSPQGPWTVTSVYDLTPRRLNNLRHVFSVDFAPDAVMPPGTLPPPPMTKVPVPLLGPAKVKGVMKHPSKRGIQRKKVNSRVLVFDATVSVVKGPRGAISLVVTLHDSGSRRVNLKQNYTKKRLVTSGVRPRGVVI